MKAHLERDFRAAEGADLSSKQPRTRPLFDIPSKLMLGLMLAVCIACLWLGATWGR